MYILNSIIEILLLVVPESLLISFITLIFLKRSDFLYKENIKNSLNNLFLFIVIPYSIFIYVLYSFNINMFIRIFFNACTMCMLMYFMLGYFNLKDSIIKNFVNIIKLYIFSLLPIIILFSTEILTRFSLQYLFNIKISNLWIDFTFTIPSKLILGFIVYINYIKQNIKDKFILGIIWKDETFFKKILYIQVTFNIILALIIYDKFVIKNILITLDINTQLFIGYFIFIHIVIQTLSPWIIISIIKYKQSKKLV